MGCIATVLKVTFFLFEYPDNIEGQLKFLEPVWRKLPENINHFVRDGLSQSFNQSIFIYIAIFIQKIATQCALQIKKTIPTTTSSKPSTQAHTNTLKTPNQRNIKAQSHM